MANIRIISIPFDRAKIIWVYSEKDIKGLACILDKPLLEIKDSQIKEMGIIGEQKYDLLIVLDNSGYFYIYSHKAKKGVS